MGRYSVFLVVFNMGVKDLWSVLEPCSEKRPLDVLEGKTVAVDLGFWVCEMQAAIKNPTVMKAHLRNLFFRISSLLQRQVNVIVVADGKPPELKRQAMLERQKYRYNRNGMDVTRKDPSANVGRSKFMGQLKECIELLRCMGVPVVESDGEAESTCAAMNDTGIVDAVITDDSDAFLYGARLVIRNFNLEGKIPEAYFYNMDIIERRLGLTQKKLIAMGVLLGSDYCSAGVPGVGKETSLKYLKHFGQDEDDLLLAYLKLWTSNGIYNAQQILEQLVASESIEFKKLDKALRSKAALAKDLIIDAVIDEYTRHPVVKLVDTKWRVPNLVALQAFLTRHLDWVPAYVVAKVVPLMTLWQLLHRNGQDEITVENIVKTRIRNGNPFYEIRWRKLAYDVWTEEGFYETLERKDLVDKSLMTLVDDYSQKLAKKKSGKKTTSRKTKPKCVPEPDIEKESVHDLSSVLERSLILIDDDDMVDVKNSPSKKPANVCEPTVEEICISKKESCQSRMDAFIKILPINENNEKQSTEGSPLPLWKRIGLRQGWAVP